MGGLTLGSTGSWAQVTTFDYTGAEQTYVVPAGVTLINIEAFGAEGGTSDNDAGTCIIGGLGGTAEGDLTVTPGETLYIYVGGEGFHGNVGGWNGGGESCAFTTTCAKGGGASDVRQGGADLTDRIIVAGGGGGAEWSGCSGEAGGGGGLEGEGGYHPSPGGRNGGGGTQVAGGEAGVGGYSGSIGEFGVGGAAGAHPSGHSGSGGGGWYGGGGGAEDGHAGGGSSYIAGLVGATTTGGVREGDGQIIITVLCEAIEVDVTDEEICLGESFTLDAAGIGEITWDGGVENGEPFTPDDAGIYTYTATSDDDGDCGFSIDIEVLELPEVTASVDSDEICVGESVVLNGGGADDYEWFPIDIEDGEDYSPEVGEYTYTVIGTDDETGCENTAEVDVTVYDLPEVVATVTDEEICLGESVTLNGEGAVTYAWDPEEEDGVEFTTDATGTTTYTVEGTDDNGCVNEAEIDVTVYEALEITYTTTDEILGSDGEIDITVTGGSTPYTFDWDNDGTGDFDDDEDLTGLTGGTYIVVVMCGAGCSATETITADSQVGIDELNGLAVSVYPNPASELIIISLEGTFNYILTTIGGDVVINGNGFNVEEISLDALAKGIYMINVFAGDQSAVIKLVKE